MELPEGTSAGCWLPSTGEGLSVHISSILHSVCERECVPGSGHPRAVSPNRCPPRPHSDSDDSSCTSQCLWVRATPHVGQDTRVSTWKMGSRVQLSGNPSPLLRVSESLLPLSIPEQGSLLTSHLFPQVPPGAAETQKAPGASELHGGHLQGTGARWEGSGRKGSSGPRHW